jgi:dephospho-CoA kinase
LAKIGRSANLEKSSGFREKRMTARKTSVKKVAITGGFSCGKSSVCRFFKELGAHVVSADEIVHQLLSVKRDLGQKVIALLGEDIVVDGEIDRKVIATKVFSDRALLRSLENIIHPAVLNEVEKEYQQINHQGKVPLFVAEIPLLFEIAQEKLFDATIAVWADEETCRKRFITATGMTAEEYERRAANQMPPEEKARRANYVIKNTGSKACMQKEVADLFIQLTVSNS